MLFLSLLVSYRPLAWRRLSRLIPKPRTSVYSLAKPEEALRSDLTREVIQPELREQKLTASGREAG